MEQNKLEDAVGAYREASNYKPNKYFTPAYLLKEALAYEKLNQNDKAIAGIRTHHQGILGFTGSANCEEVEGEVGDSFVSMAGTLKSVTGNRSLSSTRNNSLSS